MGKRIDLRHSYKIQTLAATGKYTAQEIASYFEDCDYNATQIKRHLKTKYPEEHKMLRREVSRGAVKLKTILSKIYPTVSIKEEQYVGKKLRLDFYIGEPYNICFEYDGVQHGKKVDHFHKSDDDFQKAVDRDKLKEELCQGRGITLVRIAHNEVLTEELVLQKIEDVGYGNGIIQPGFETSGELHKRKNAKQNEYVKERKKKRYQEFKKSAAYEKNKQKQKEYRKQQYQKAKEWQKNNKK